MPDTPKAQRHPRESPRKKRIAGRNLLGMTYMADDWDAPMTPEELALFEKGEVLLDGAKDDPPDCSGE